MASEYGAMAMLTTFIPWKGKTAMHALKLVAASALAIAATSTMAAAQMPGVYVLHSGAQGACPALDWHVTVGQGNVLAGVIGWDNFTHLAHVSGQLDPNTRHFQMTAKEVNGDKTATIVGNMRLDGYMTATVTGPGIACTNVTIPYYVTGSGPNG